MLELLERAEFKPTAKPLREPTDHDANVYYYINLASH